MFGVDRERQREQEMRLHYCDPHGHQQEKSFCSKTGQRAANTGRRGVAATQLHRRNGGQYHVKPSVRRTRAHAHEVKGNATNQAIINTLETPWLSRPLLQPSIYTQRNPY